MTKICGIYIIKNVVNGRSYVGSSINYDYRKRSHLWALRHGTHHSIKLQRAWIKYGPMSFEFQLIEFCCAKEDLIKREQFWIDTLNTYKSGYNSCPIAKSNLGSTHICSEVTKQKISESHKKSGHSFSIAAIEKARELRIGQHLTNEVRQKISMSSKGRKMSEDHRNKISLSHTGMSHSLESREKMSKNKTGATASEETKKKMSESQKLRRRS